MLLTIWRGKSRKVWWDNEEDSQDPRSALHTCRRFLNDAVHSNRSTMGISAIQHWANHDLSKRVPFCPALCRPCPLRRRILVALSLALVGFFLECLKTLEKATFMCCSGVIRRKYLQQIQHCTIFGIRLWEIRERIKDYQAIQWLLT